MPIDERVALCGDCGARLSEDPSTPAEQRLPCPHCGSTIEREYQVSVGGGTLTSQSSLRMKARRSSRGKPFVKQYAGDDLQRSTGEWMKLDRRIDPDNDLYRETIINPKTGEVVHKCEEPLSEHRGHGSAKFSRKTKPEGA